MMGTAIAAIAVKPAATILSSTQPSQKQGHRGSRFNSSLVSWATGIGAKKTKRITLGQLIHLLRRILVIVAAILYIKISICACVDSVHLLQSTRVPSVSYYVYQSKLMGQYAGTTTVRESPLLAALDHDTSPRNGSLFLEADSTQFTGCTSVNNSVVWQDTFQRSIFAALVTSTAYNLTFLDPAVTELIMPVVDCTATSLLTADVTAPRMFYLMRMVDDPDDVYILSVTIGLQEYHVAKQKASGPGAFAMIAFVNDMRATEIKHYFAAALGVPFQVPTFQVYQYHGRTSDGFWLLKSVPENPLTEASKVVSTSSPTGSYISSTNEQTNIIYLIWHSYQDPLTMLVNWQWNGVFVMRDSRAWVHLLHLYFAVVAALSLLVLLVVMYYNIRLGKIWVGDAFAAISATHWLRSGLVLFSWYMNKFWALMEFTLFSGNTLATTRSAYLNPSVMRADLLSLYLSLVGIIGHVTNERIDPALTLALFYIGFEARIAITKLFPGMVSTLIAYADDEFALGISELDPSVPEISPLRVWNSHPLPKADASVVLAALAPVFTTLVFILAYVVVRKVRRRFFPSLIEKQRSSLQSSAASSKENGVMKTSLTQFEFATGVQLKTRFGVASDYDNYVYIKGMKFASADGIYTCGFVIANGKFLIHTDDLNAILAMKITRIRFKNVYVYEVEGNSVKQTAQLIYPETISFRDILHLNLRILL